MVSKNQNKPPELNTTTPANPSKNKRSIDVSVSKRRKVEVAKTVWPGNGRRTRQPLSVVNGSQDLAAMDGPVGNSSSDCSSMEFTKEDVEALLNEKIKTKNRFSVKISSLNDMYKRLQEYNTSLQQYNTKLQSDLATANETLKRVEKEKASVLENLSTLRGHYTSLQDQLTSSRASQDEAMKQKEALVSEVGCIRGDLQQVREDRDRQLLQAQALTTEVVKYKEWTGKYVAELDHLTLKSNDLEARCLSQSEQIRTLRDQLSAADKKLQMSDSSAVETRTMFEEKTKLIHDLQSRLGVAEVKINEGEELRRKLHNTILELKGNIRVFCRVRPLLSDEDLGTEPKVYSYPTTAETLGRGIDVIQNGQKSSFTFDKVFVPDAGQENVFVEISQLVQSALDGYKVCIFAYGQTGSGKTYTMMGRPGSPTEKGLIPRSLEQIFQTIQSLQSQGWKYEMQVSMLEIYNETIRDLLSSNQSCSDVSRTESGVAGKQYAIKHDANGNTHVSDLTIVDVCSSREVSFLLDQAARSRSVGKTQMNEQSSRSHFVFTLRISGANESTEQQVQGVLNLIDLAGSERLSKSGATGDRLKETQAINKSLSSLSDVIFALAKKEDHVPFRNSKLTYLLQSTEQQVQGVLNLIDLAGSERLSKSGATGDRLKETQAINKSLSSLSDVIFALAKKEDHVPFRNSKLTYLLQPCLGGDSKTLMFVNVSPEPSSVGESLCSLRFAARVNACEIGIPRRQTNVRSSDSRLSYG
ncbi:Kinesin-like protein [Actinidia chinensis var. chinensis]|uniref:Kinesin-like protein n=1 Tax=Actinidia chinensis var. chinensis TaxID=1590841 RepID=A0A2R6PRH1_ACTCC|nr:Kinesin-like protein [Actinidia chinensis var. chinensis]